MLGRDVLRALLADPAANAPEVNVALAEEGDLEALHKLVKCAGVTSDVLDAIGRRIEDEGAAVGTDPDAPPPDSREARRRRTSDGEDVDPELEALKADPVGVLDGLLVRHAHARASLLDAVALRHPNVPDYVLHAALHPNASPDAVTRAARWPSRSPLHDRPWLARLGPDAPTLETWAASDDPLLREAAARIAMGSLRRTLARDTSRRVRRACATGGIDDEVQRQLACDPCPDVRERAGRRAASEPAGDAWLLGAMKKGGVMADDAAGALVEAGTSLDAEGAALVGMVLPPEQVARVLGELDETSVSSDAGIGLAVGLARRAPEMEDGRLAEGHEEGVSELIEACVRVVARSKALPVSPVLTGKARLAAWLGEVVARGDLVDEDELAAAMVSGAVGAHGILLARWIGARAGRAPGLVKRLVGSLLAVARGTRAAVVPARFLSIAWDCADVGDDEMLALARAGAAPPLPGSRLARADSDAAVAAALEVDLDPLARSLQTLDQVVLSMRAPLAPSLRAALAVVPSDPRRSRMVVQSLPTWQGEPTGRRIHRLLKANAIALSAAGRAPSSSGPSIPPLWSSRDLPEGELAVGLVTGTLSAQDVADRVRKGRPPLTNGLMLGAAMDAAASKGKASLAPLVELCDEQARHDAALLAAAIIAGPGVRAKARPMQSAMAMVAAMAERVGAAPMACVVEALATLERRKPGTLEAATPGSPVARAVVGSAIARAYQSIG
ncbi:MAG: hypothetical protein IT379_26005 [Deltaproteobacteria bacterium]|nr:hypothetical protein [Deltaproteobacteria bacterium]